MVVLKVTLVANCDGKVESHFFFFLLGRLDTCCELVNLLNEPRLHAYELLSLRLYANVIWVLKRNFQENYTEPGSPQYVVRCVLGHKEIFDSRSGNLVGNVPGDEKGCYGCVPGK